MPKFIATTTQPNAPQIPYNKNRKTLDVSHSGTSDGITVTSNVVMYDFTGDQQGASVVGVRILPYGSKYFNKLSGDDPTRGMFFQSVGGNVQVEWAEAP